MRKKWFWIMAFLLFIINMYLLFYRLGDIPRGIHVDEAGSYYDAMSLVRYGVDRYLYRNPVYFINYGGGMNALYTYLVCLSFKVFGSSLWSFRLVAVIVNLISYYFYSKFFYFYKNRFCSIVCLLLLTIFPVFIMKARWGLESYLFCPMFMISIYYYYMAIQREKNCFFLIAGIFFGITLYTYAISYLILFLFLFFSVVYLLMIKKINIKNIMVMVVPLGLLAFPLLLMLLINKGIINHEFVTSFLSVPRLWEYRVNEISFVNFQYFFSNFIIYFNHDFLSYNAIPTFGTMYLYSFSNSFVLMGFIISVIKIFKDKRDYFNVLLFWGFLVTIFVCSLVKDLNINKANVIYVFFVYFIILTFEWLFKNRYKLMLVLCLVLYLCNFILFYHYYFYSESNVDKVHVFFEDNSLFEALNYANRVREHQCICLNQKEAYIYVLLYHRISPYDFNSKSKIDKLNKMVQEYDYYRFSCGDVSDNVIYIFDANESFLKIYVDNGFRKKIIGNYVVLFKQ